MAYDIEKMAIGLQVIDFHPTLRVRQEKIQNKIIPFDLATE